MGGLVVGEGRRGDVGTSTSLLKEGRPGVMARLPSTVYTGSPLQIVVMPSSTTTYSGHPASNAIPYDMCCTLLWSNLLQTSTLQHNAKTTRLRPEQTRCQSPRTVDLPTLGAERQPVHEPSGLPTARR
jgi:hypothetical protein